MGEKKCTRCEEIKPLDEFSYRDKAKGLKKPQCKECDKSIRKDFYEKNKEKVLEGVLRTNKEIIKRNQQFVWDYLKEHPCIVCGESNPIVLEFDHRDETEKTSSISRMAAHQYSIEKIKDEIEKCDVRCSNCHKIRTAEQFDWHKNIIK